MHVKKIIVSLIVLVFLLGCDNEKESNAPLELRRAFVGTMEINLDGSTGEGFPTDRSINLVFSSALNLTSATQAITLTKDGQPVAITVSLASSGTTAIVYPAGLLENGSTYSVRISDQLQGSGGESFSSKEISFKTSLAALTVVSAKFGDKFATASTRVVNVPVDLSIIVDFSIPVDASTLPSALKLSGTGSPVLQVSLSEDKKTATITGTTPLKDLRKYTFTISNALRGTQGETFTEYSRIFYSGPDNIKDFPEISDDALLTKVQQQTFKYFWDYAHPASGMSRERNTNDDVVTSGGSGFGIMAIIVGVERNFITRAEALQRMDKILTFLEKADRFHGAWSHWLNGNTGIVIPFSDRDNGGDLVETSYLVEGLITFRQYLKESVPQEASLIDRINALCNGVEWDWYRQNNQDVLYWHWSPNQNWTMNLPIKGWNECLITYVLGASSSTHPIPEVVYQKGWASEGAMRNGATYEGVTLPLGPQYGGPLFFAHYSFVGMDPTNLSDTYADYFSQNTNHTLINYKYSVRNPLNYAGYSEECWGLTASDNNINGYSAHSPTNDLGVITPTAALSSMPYTPEESMRALKFFYYKIGDRLWGEYGFYDAFNITDQWTASSYLAIDQGPIIIMIENHRTGLLWDLFMSAPEVQQGLDKLGFNY